VLYGQAKVLGDLFLKKHVVEKNRTGNTLDFETKPKIMIEIRLKKTRV